MSVPQPNSIAILRPYFLRSSIAVGSTRVSHLPFICQNLPFYMPAFYTPTIAILHPNIYHFICQHLPFYKSTFYMPTFTLLYVNIYHFTCQHLPFYIPTFNTLYANIYHIICQHLPFISQHLPFYMSIFTILHAKIYHFTCQHLQLYMLTCYRTLSTVIKLLWLTCPSAMVATGA